jgi:hypothetical protein
VTFDDLVAAAREGRLSDGRADPTIAAFLDTFAPRLKGDPVASLLSCAAEYPPLADAARAWADTHPHPPFLRRLANAAPRVAIESQAGLDGYALSCDAAGSVAVLVDNGTWPTGHKVVVFDVPGRRCRAILDGDRRKWGTGVSVSADGTWAAVAGGRTPMVLDLTRDELRPLPKSHRRDLHAACIVSDDTFAVGDEDGIIRIWSRTGEPGPKVTHADTYVMGLAVRDSVLWSVGFDGRARAWRLPDLAPLADLPAPGGRTIVALPGGDILVSGARLGLDGTVRYSLPEGHIVVSGDTVAVATGTGIATFDLATGNPLGNAPGHREPALAGAPGAILAVERYTGTLEVLPLPFAEPADQGAKTQFMLPSPDGQRILAGEGGGGTLGPVTTEIGANLHVGANLRLHDRDGAFVAALPKADAPHAWAGPLLLTRVKDALVAWNADGRRAWTAKGVLPERLFEQRGTGRAFAAWIDGNVLHLSARQEGEGLDLRDENGALLAEFGPWPEVRACLAAERAWFSTRDRVGAIEGGRIAWETPVEDPRSVCVEGGLLAVVSGPTLRILDAATGAERAVGRGRFRRPLHSCAFFAGRLWTGGEDGHVRSWDPATGAPLSDAAIFKEHAWHLRGGPHRLHAVGGRWNDVFLGRDGSRLEPWASLTSSHSRFLPEGSYGDHFTVHDLRTGEAAEWWAPRENACAAAVEDRIYLGWRMTPGPIEVLEWVERR